MGIFNEVGFAGPMDLEVMGGRRAQDWFGGMTTSAAVGDAELHGELAAFHVPSDALGAASFSVLVQLRVYL